MWGWTKMGARVIVTPGELSTSGFSHPLLPAMKVVPQPAVAEQPEPNEPPAAKADKGAPEPKPVEASLELRSSVDHDDAALLRDQTRTADAGGVRASTASDASSGSNSPAPNATAPKADEAKPEAANADNGKAERAKADSAPQAASTDTVGKDTKISDTGDAAKSDTGADAKPADVAAKPAGDAAKPAESASIKSEEKPAATKPAEARPDAAKAADAAKPAEPVKAVNAVTPPASAADARKDQTRLTEIKPAVKPEKRREGQVAVFISRKDSKLYVRQNFAPWFEVPVTIAPSDRPLGTHIFTATVDKNDSNALHWSVVTVPMSARAAMRDSDMPRASRRKGKNAPTAVEAKPTPLPDSAAEALDRITIPADVMARVGEALATGSSIVVSDQGINQGETGEYTDFIIRTY
jgi:hypothetical protein